jgi:hypothetical protein
MVARGRLLTIAFFAAFAILSCLGPESDPDSNTYLEFQNPELTTGFDSMFVHGANAQKRDTLLIWKWLKNETFPAKIAYPPGLEATFTLLVKGYKGSTLAYESRTLIDSGKAQAQSRTVRMAAPVLRDAPEILMGRIGEGIDLTPVWETRPGIYRQADSGAAEMFTPEAVFTWSRKGESLGSDSVLHLGPLAFGDSGTYKFLAENPEGKDSMEFQLTIKHNVPKIEEIDSYAVVAGKPFNVFPVITRTDSLLYRWTKNGTTVSQDSVLTFTALRAQDTGVYQLRVVNFSDTLLGATSNPFTVSLDVDPNDVWQAEKPISVGAQAVTTRGSTMDLDIPKAMLYAEAAQKQNTIELLYMYSGAALRLMSPVAAKNASDLTYADEFSDSQIKDVKYVKVTGKPATPSAGRALFEKGPQVNNLGVTGGQSFLLKTTAGKLVWLKVVSYAGSGSSATAELSVAIGPY